VLQVRRDRGNGTVAHFGVSFGGNFAAMSGLSGIVDAAVDLGGPVVGACAIRKAPEVVPQIITWLAAQVAE
jgi:hypothetical protein